MYDPDLNKPWWELAWNAVGNCFIEIIKKFREVLKDNEFWGWIVLGTASIIAIIVIIAGIFIKVPFVGDILIGAGIGFLMGTWGNIFTQVSEVGWDNINLRDALRLGGVSAFIGAVSGFTAGYLGQIFAQYGRMFGYQVSQASIWGLQIGKGFSYLGGVNMITSVFQFGGKTLGAFLGGSLGNEIASSIFGINPTVEENMHESAVGIVQGVGLNFLKEILIWIWELIRKK